MKVYRHIIVPVTLSACIATSFGILLQNFIGKEYFLEDIGGIGWLLGVVGTIYTLVAAFTMVEVWNQFNNTSKLISNEAKSIISLWNYTDYLNDKNIDQKMQTSLLAYLDQTLTKEHDQASKGIRSLQPSQEIITIRKVIDEIEFDDKRDASIFPILTQAYEELSTARNDRIEAGVTRLPAMIKIFFISLSLMLMVSYILVGYVHLPLYIIHTIFGASIISLTYKIIFDLDNPFDGFWNIDYSAMTQAKEYITNNRH
ncbi:hypothetical protein A3K29_00230 [Candidatus Collierbacteria bacterium RIFOXYB2_FULL_46_14]|uniref:DUF4239 domain-containing protein n=1 Tax=Candidatus Collierbacteria bacterium GW2011_GWA2_46_26 TaxID=1618381 RepID=A0A0G1PLS3_9BACT|nr:MAG: hypothetical protein UW29_C0001G0025 [Candidatus Collierbacteria bacterium GW2011_GWC2_44_13]KKU33617.1 MAG: hypothetical protein UX47_C0002G0025 [Candidatus Collierbacteria bacterium GW2011_GWA2_46_26]OGD72565.1 MAG: hypothetical protein A3K29_00230 [Candidatus Collierbacteria bacterium RIFOXYB2_FULL_46_14]OGD75607.1 MAG: hypothetical protein A3K43_00230 [Candidatus Collierbacteria bacterium RIFOXYA2_FULL_46_20]OGD76943.1 MAG: hypothetical protein A3K39_00230 [Candidatus Collierbacteri